MRNHAFSVAAATTGILLATGFSTPRAVEPGVRVTHLDDGVYALVRTEPLGLAVNANSLVIVNDSDIVVVDAQFTRKATLENIAAIRSISRKPVRYVVNSHWHDDHVAGNQVYQDSFPGVEFIGHEATRTALETLGRQNRAGQVQGAPPAADRMERLLRMNLGPDSSPATPAERAGTASAIAIIREYVAENAGYREVLPDLLVTREFVLHRGRRTILVRWFGRGNTPGDLAVFIPEQRILATGDLLVWPVPFGFNSYPGEWIGVLDSLQGLRPAVIVPGHGPIMRDLEYLNLVQRTLKAARAEALAALAIDPRPAEVLRRVTLDSLRPEFLQLVGDEKWGRFLFSNMFRGPVVRRVIEEHNGLIKE